MPKACRPRRGEDGPPGWRSRVTSRRCCGCPTSARGPLLGPHHAAPAACTPSPHPRWGPGWLAGFVDTVSAPTKAQAPGGAGAGMRRWQGHHTPSRKSWTLEAKFYSPCVEGTGGYLGQGSLDTGDRTWPSGQRERLGLRRRPRSGKKMFTKLPSTGWGLPNAPPRLNPLSNPEKCMVWSPYL